MPQTGCKRITLRALLLPRGDKRETWSNKNKLPIKMKSLECETPRRREDVWVFGSRLPEVDTSQMSGSQADLATPSVGFQWLPPGCSNLRGKLEWPAGLTQIVSWRSGGSPRATMDLQRVYTATVQRTTPTTPCSGGACLRCAPHTGCYACRVRRWHSALTCARALRGAARRL